MQHGRPVGSRLTANINCSSCDSCNICPAPANMRANQQKAKKRCKLFCHNNNDYDYDYLQLFSHILCQLKKMHDSSKKEY